MRRWWLAGLIAAFSACSPSDDPAAIDDAGPDAAVDSDTAPDATQESDVPDLGLAPRTARWERIDSAFPIAAPYATHLIASDVENLYALVQVDDSPAKSWNVLRSDDDGDTWSIVYERSAGNAVQASFFGDVDGRLFLVIPNLAEAALLASDDHGTTWTELPNVPKSLNRAVAREGDNLLVTGSWTHRYTATTAMWEPIEGGSEVAANVRAVRFGDAYLALSEVGARFRLADDATQWHRLATGPGAVTDLWRDGDVLWLKTTASLMTSTDGEAWSERLTAVSDRYGQVYRAPDGGPWVLADEVPAGVFLSEDQGATATDVTFNFPRDDNGRLCISRFVATTRVAVASTQRAEFDAAGCTPGVDPEAGVFRYPFED